MGIKPADETQLRQYLLGLLPESESDEIEQNLLRDEDFAKTVEAVEDEIVDDYLDGTLIGANKQAAEDHFFRSPEHRRKLYFAQLLRSQLGKEKPPVIQHSTYLGIKPALYWGASVAIACLLVLTAGLAVYTAKLRRTVESEMANNRSAQTSLQADLAQERAKVSQLKEALGHLKNQNDAGGSAGQASVIVTPSLLEREMGAIPQVSLGPQWLELHIPLLDFDSPSYKANLRNTGGKVLWSSTNLKSSHKLLILKIPCKLLSPGQYFVVISGEGESRSITYTFRAS